MRDPLGFWGSQAQFAVVRLYDRRAAPGLTIRTGRLLGLDLPQLDSPNSSLAFRQKIASLASDEMSND